MEVRRYTPGDLAGVHALFNELTVGRVPHCWPVDPGILGNALAEADIEREGARLTEQVVLVAARGNKVAGFVHLAAEAANKRGGEKGVIRFLAYRRGQRAVGDALLQAAEAWMRDRGLARSVMLAQPWKYSFFAFPHAWLSDHLDHVQALLRFRGFQKSDGEVFLDWVDMHPEPPVDSSGLDYELRIEDCPGGTAGLQLRALQDDQEIGECLLQGGSTYSAATEAGQYIFCKQLNVTQRYQGRGLGRFLLAHGLCLARDRGYRHGAISTAHDNDRAFLFYANHGFHVVDWTYEFTREFSGPVISGPVISGPAASG